MSPLEALLGGNSQRKQRKVLDVIPFPEEHIPGLLERMDACQEARLNDYRGHNMAFINQWRFIAEVLPYVRGKECSLNFGRGSILHPSVLVHGKARTPVVGEDGVVDALEIPADRLFHVCELADAVRFADSRQDLDSAAPTYRLWHHLRELFPVVDDPAKRSTLDWALSLDLSFTGLIARLKNPDESED